jgi:hypothetical protein
MTSYSENDQASLSLVRRYARGRGWDLPLDAVAEDGEGTRHADLLAIPEDRISPSIAGGLVGIASGMIALAIVHAMAPDALGRSIVAVAHARGVGADPTFVLAYATSGSLGAIAGATFAVVTRYLRKWFPLSIWALVFFVSLGMLLLAASKAYGRGVAAELSGPILLGSAAFGLLVSFSLPIRRCR